MGRLVRKRALSGRINPMIMSENMIGFTRVTRAKPSWRHADTIQSLSSLDERGPMWGRKIMGNAQTHTMTAIMTQAIRFPATSHVQITMSATMMTVREARPAVLVMSSEARAHLSMYGRSQKNAGVSSKLDARKILGRTIICPP